MSRGRGRIRGVAIIVRRRVPVIDLSFISAMPRLAEPSSVPPCELNKRSNSSGWLAASTVCPCATIIGDWCLIRVGGDNTRYIWRAWTRSPGGIGNVAWRGGLGKIGNADRGNSNERRGLIHMKETQEGSGNVNTQSRVKKYVKMESSYSMSAAIGSSDAIGRKAKWNETTTLTLEFTTKDAYTR
jgi:hypothetical protein